MVPRSYLSAACSPADVSPCPAQNTASHTAPRPPPCTRTSWASTTSAGPRRLSTRGPSPAAKAGASRRPHPHGVTLTTSLPCFSAGRPAHSQPASCRVEIASLSGPPSPRWPAESRGSDSSAWRCRPHSHQVPRLPPSLRSPVLTRILSHLHSLLSPLLPGAFPGLLQAPVPAGRVLTTAFTTWLCHSATFSSTFPNVCSH